MTNTASCVNERFLERVEETRSFFGESTQKDKGNFVQKTVYFQDFFVIEWHKEKPTVLIFASDSGKNGGCRNESENHSENRTGRAGRKCH